MLFMVIETFRDQDAKAVYSRFRDKGRQLPDGPTFQGRWVTADLERCFVLVEAEGLAELQQWVASWSDLAAFEILPVVTGTETAEALAPLLPPPGREP